MRGARAEGGGRASEEVEERGGGRGVKGGGGWEGGRLGGRQPRTDLRTPGTPPGGTLPHPGAAGVAQQPGRWPPGPLLPAAWRRPAPRVWGRGAALQARQGGHPHQRQHHARLLAARLRRARAVCRHTRPEAALAPLRTPAVPGGRGARGGEGGERQASGRARKTRVKPAAGRGKRGCCLSPCQEGVAEGRRQAGRQAAGPPAARCTTAVGGRHRGSGGMLHRPRRAADPPRWPRWELPCQRAAEWAAGTQRVGHSQARHPRTPRPPN
jgi:hypothetical protein